MQVGDQITVRVYKADGVCYRWWQTAVSRITPNCIITVSPAGQNVYEVNRIWQSNYILRTYYWLNKMYSLLEVYKPDGAFQEIYVNINSPTQHNSEEMWNTDFELDVIKLPGQVAKIIDEDEFAEAIIKYGYSKSFQEKCYRTAVSAVHLANTWIPKTAPKLS